MKLIIELLIILVFLIIIILFFLTKIIKNQLNIYDIKIKKSMAKMKKLLNNKFELLLKTIDFLKKNISIDEEDLNNFLNINLKKTENIELDNILMETDQKIKVYFDQYEKLINDKNFIDINKEMNQLNISIKAIKKYYNESVNEYNTYIKKFPNKIIAKLTKHQRKVKFKESTKTKLKILN